MSSKRRNGSRWDTSRNSGASPLPSSSPANAKPPPPDAAAPSTNANATDTEPPPSSSDAAPAPSPTAAATAAASAPAHAPAAAPARAPERVAAPPASDFVLDYHYELSLAAQNVRRRAERQQQWMDPGQDYSNERSHDPSGYGPQGRPYGSYPGEAPPQSDYRAMPQYSKVSQHYQGRVENDKLQGLGQPSSGLGSEAPYSVDPEMDRWRAIELARQNANMYRSSSGHGDEAHHMQLSRSAEISSERALGGRGMDANMIDRQGNSPYFEGRDGFSQDVKIRASFDKMSAGLQDPNLYCSVCAYAFSNPYQKQVHLQSHVKCEEEQCPFEAIETKVKEHMLSEHGKHFQNLLRSSGGALREIPGARMSENSRGELETAGINRNSDFLDPREGQREGFLMHGGVRSQDARNEMELAARKSRDKWNSRMANSSSRYFPY